MDCANNLIGIKGSCSDATLSSSLYLNDLGIDIPLLNKLATKSYKNGEDLASQKISFATKVIVDQINNHFADKFKTNSIIEGKKIGYHYDDLKVISGAAGSLRGINVELRNIESFLDVFVSDVSLQVDFTGNVPVLVYDLLTNKLLDTLTVTTVAGEISSLVVNKTYKSNRKKLNIIFVYDTTLINSYQTSIYKSGECGSCEGYCKTNSYLRMRGVSINSASTKVNGNLTTLSNTAGMTVNYSLQCNHSDWLCTIVNRLAMPLLYKSAADIYKFGADNSTRQNDATLIDDLKRLSEENEFKYRESMDNLIKTIKLPSDWLCYQCNERSKHKVILP